MAHGNKKYFFEQLQSNGDSITIKPNKGKQIVNTYSVANQLRKYQNENTSFEFNIELHKNGNATITRNS